MLGDEIAFGLDVRSALENLARRVGQEDLLFLTHSREHSDPDWRQSWEKFWTFDYPN